MTLRGRRPHGAPARRRERRLHAAVLVLFLLGAGLARAHERSTSYSTWRLDGPQATVTLRLTTFDLSRIPPDAVRPGGNVPDWLASQLVLSAGGTACAPTGPARRLDDAGGLAAFEWVVRCPARGPLVLRSNLLREIAPSHLHFARVLRPGAPAAERVLSSDAPVWTVPEGGDDTASAAPRGFVWLGVEDILTGWDHLAFVAALLLGAATLADVARVVTGFTLGHSLTLGLATLGWMRADAPAVEALVGASIALVALESLWASAAPDPWLPRAAAAALVAMAALRLLGRGAVPVAGLLGLALFVVCVFRAPAEGVSAGAMRWGVASLFGLVHGFGFAAVLAQASLDAGHPPAALSGFNVGVEAGQLAVVGVAWPLLVAARRAGQRGRLLQDVASAVLIALGTCWFVGRCYG